MQIGFIGAGKVGFTLGKYFVTHGIRVTGYLSRDTGSAKAAADFTDTKVFTDKRELVENCDALFLTVPDGEITAVYDEIKHLGIRGKLIVHTSGSLPSSEAFPDIKDFGAYGYSVHPLFAVSDKYSAYRELKDVFFAVEGDNEGIDKIKGLMENAGLSFQVIDPESKVRYHCAASIASNLVVALMDESITLLESCGFSEADARKALRPLSEGNIRHVLDDGAAKALTGPVERADLGTVVKHIDCLDSLEEKKMYKILSGHLVEIARKKHPERSYDKMAELLEQDS